MRESHSPLATRWECTPRGASPRRWWLCCRGVPSGFCRAWLSLGPWGANFLVPRGHTLAARSQHALPHRLPEAQPWSSSQFVESRRGRPRMHAAHSGVLDREGNAPPKSKSSPSTGVLPATHALAPHSLGVPTSWAWPSTVVRLCATAPLVVEPGRAKCISKWPMGRMKPDGLQRRIGLQGPPSLAEVGRGRKGHTAPIEGDVHGASPLRRAC